MNKIKYFAIIILVLFMTGCKGTYDITIEDDLTVKEQINVLLNKNSNSLDKIDALLKSNKNDNSKYSIEDLNNQIRIKYEKSYSSIKEYLSSSILYNEVFDNYLYDNDKNSISIVNMAKLNKNDSNSNNISNSLDLGDIKIRLNSKLDISAANYDEIDENYYVWNIDDNTSNKNIIFDISLRSKKANMKYLIIMVSTFIMLIISIIMYEKFKKKDGLA